MIYWEDCILSRKIMVIIIDLAFVISAFIGYQHMLKNMATPTAVAMPAR